MLVDGLVVAPGWPTDHLGIGFPDFLFTSKLHSFEFCTKPPLAVSSFADWEHFLSGGIGGGYAFTWRLVCWIGW